MSDEVLEAMVAERESMFMEAPDVAMRRVLRAALEEAGVERPVDIKAVCREAGAYYSQVEVEAQGHDFGSWEAGFAAAVESICTVYREHQRHDGALDRLRRAANLSEGGGADEGESVARGFVRTEELEAYPDCPGIVVHETDYREQEGINGDPEDFTAVTLHRHPSTDHEDTP